VDPPRHFLPAGETIDEIDLELLRGPCVIVDVARSVREIGPADIATIPSRTTRVLFRTANSARWARRLDFFPDYVALGSAAARSLIARGVRLVGIDSLSVESDPTGSFPVHHALLGGGALILEGLLLEQAPAGAAELECLPLKIRGGDGGPARAVLAVTD
jgi:arylformamidase